MVETVIFLLGIVQGLLLAVWIIHLSWIIERHREKRHSAIQEQALLDAREEAAIEIDDDRMVCSTCWEGRHPGQAWSLQRRTLCIDHLLQTGKPEPIQWATKGSVNTLVNAEGSQIG